MEKLVSKSEILDIYNNSSNLYHNGFGDAREQNMPVHITLGRR